MRFEVTLTTDAPGLALSLDRGFRSTSTSRWTQIVEADDHAHAREVAKQQHLEKYPEQRVLEIEVDGRTWYDVTFRSRRDGRRRHNVPVCVSDQQRDRALTRRRHPMTMEEYLRRSVGQRGLATGASIDWDTFADLGEVIAWEVSSVQ